MVDRPILFSAPMVRALLAGTKTQTRRVIELPTKTHSGGPIYERPDMGGWEVTTHGGAGCFMIGKNGERLPVPEVPGLWHKTTGTCVGVRYAIGDRLWVKESWTVGGVYTDVIETRYRAHERASHTEFVEQIPVDRVGKLTRARWPKYASSLHMPRWASRITLIVTDVRLERLQDISEADARAEGVDISPKWSAVVGYETLWNLINGKGTWDTNPWVVAVSFEVKLGNIDAPALAALHPPP